MTAYQPSCIACRDNLPTYYKACGGCQARRAAAMQAFHNVQTNVLPVPSSDGPVPMTYQTRPKDGPGWRRRNR